MDIFCHRPERGGVNTSVTWKSSRANAIAHISAGTVDRWDQAQGLRCHGWGAYEIVNKICYSQPLVSSAAHLPWSPAVMLTDNRAHMMSHDSTPQGWLCLLLVAIALLAQYSSSSHTSIGSSHLCISAFVFMSWVFYR
ncbi:unnamed protein product [Arctogadus glacialis]